MSVMASQTISNWTVSSTAFRLTSKETITVTGNTESVSMSWRHYKEVHVIWINWFLNFIYKYIFAAPMSAWLDWRHWRPFPAIADGLVNSVFPKPPQKLTNELVSFWGGFGKTEYCGKREIHLTWTVPAIGPLQYIHRYDRYWSFYHYIDVIMTTMASQITSLTVVYSTVNSH